MKTNIVSYEIVVEKTKLEKVVAGPKIKKVLLPEKKVKVPDWIQEFIVYNKKFEL